MSTKYKKCFKFVIKERILGMTHRLYYDDQYLREFSAEVISCEKKDEAFSVELNATAFFPEGGGQPGDRGRIGDAEVTDTVESNGRIFHICNKELEVGSNQNCSLDFDFRFTNMQQHSGEHIFSGFVHSVCGYDNVGFHMGEHSVTVDFNGAITKAELERIEKLTNEAIYKNIPVEALYPSKQELEKFSYRSKKEIQGQVRLTRIEGVDLCACCGTHVALTGEVGMVKVISMMNYKSGVRITLQIGRKALEDYAEKNNSVSAISNMLCAKPNEVSQAVERLTAQISELKGKAFALKKELYSLKCKDMSGDIGILFDDENSADGARILCDMLAEKVKIAAVFSGDDDSGYKYAIASRSEDIRNLGKEFNSVCRARGGGKPEMVMGSSCAKREEIEKFFSEKLK